MTEVFDIPTSTTEEIQIGFEVGRPHELPISSSDRREFTVSMRGIAHALKAGNLKPNPAWEEVFPDELTRGTHFAVAHLIAAIGAAEKVEAPEPRLSRFLGHTVLRAGLYGSTAHVISGGKPVFTIAGMIIGMRRAGLSEGKALIRDQHKDMLPHIESFLNDPDLPLAMQASIAFDFRR